MSEVERLAIITTAATVVVVVARFYVARLRIKAKADVERAALTANPLDDIAAREELAEAEAAEAALNSLPTIGKKEG